MLRPCLWLTDCPKLMLDIFHKAAKEVAFEDFQALFENYAQQDVFVRITDLPLTDPIREIRRVFNCPAQATCWHQCLLHLTAEHYIIS